MASYQLLPDDVLFLILEADCNTNGKSTLFKWRLVNSIYSRFASGLLFKTQSITFGCNINSKNTLSKSVESLRFLDANPRITQMIRKLTLRGFISTGDDFTEVPALLRKVLSKMERLDCLNWDLTVEGSRLTSENCDQEEVQAHTRLQPEGFWLSRPKTIVELYKNVAALPNLKRLCLNMPWWEAAILKPLNTKAEVHLQAPGAGIYEWEPETVIRKDNVFGPLTSLDITVQEYNGNSYVHALLEKSQNTLRHLVFRSTNGLDYPEKYENLTFPKLETLVWEVYNPNRFDRKNTGLNSSSQNSLSTFRNGKRFLGAFLERHPGIRSVKIVFNHSLFPGNVLECAAINSCARPFIDALKQLPKLEFLQFVGLPVSWEFAISIAKQHPQLQGLWLPIMLESLEEPFLYTPSTQKARPYVNELRELVSFTPKLKLLCLNTKKTWQFELSDAVSTVAKSSGTLDVAIVTWASQTKSWYRFDSNLVWGDRISKRLAQYSASVPVSNLQFWPRLPRPSGEWLDNPDWNYSEEFMSGLRDDAIGNSIFDISRTYQENRFLSITQI
ncbi:uncharacterized protein LAJ45_09616 [Morchella importuna]|uniref:uncharacterized protein n=1 Tax=Morchella importuna TaxID=1174673 RepID=UPI001E8CA2B0|nr:uncharacterized protein LAJ45_09616 [Morchella importuna]KAH8146423.1 hypothetical protein LAJ45_09616 [Morchella importuna]